MLAPGQANRNPPGQQCSANPKTVPYKDTENEQKHFSPVWISRSIETSVHTWNKPTRSLQDENEETQEQERPMLLLSLLKGKLILYSLL